MNARSLDRDRLAKVLARFESPFDGEKLAAIEAAGRILRAGGATWRDLLAGLGSDDDAPTTSRVDDGVDDGGPVAAPQHVKTITAMLRRPGVVALSEWERGFLRGCLRFDTLSKKQADMLAEVFAKIRRADA